MVRAGTTPAPLQFRREGRSRLGLRPRTLNSRRPSPIAVRASCCATAAAEAATDAGDQEGPGRVGRAWFSL